MKLNEFVDVSLKQGAKFVFHVDSNEIVFKCSLFSGKECVLVNGKLVSERRNYRRKSSHTVLVDGEEYEVIFEMKSLTKGDIECALSKGGEPIKAYKITYVKPPKQPLYLRFIPVILGGLAGFALAGELLPVWLIITMAAIAVTMSFIRDFRRSNENWECEVIE